MKGLKVWKVTAQDGSTLLGRFILKDDIVVIKNRNGHRLQHTLSDRKKTIAIRNKTTKKIIRKMLDDGEVFLKLYVQKYSSGSYLILEEIG